MHAPTMKKISLVVTTISPGNFLDDYARQIIREQFVDNVEIIVIPDRKSPADLYKKCEAVKKRGIQIICPTLPEQDEFLKKLGRIKSIIPYNSDNRRNVGYLMALSHGSEIIISIDDDNYCRNGESFFKEHTVVAQGKIDLNSVASSNGWFNICELMHLDHYVYPRGFPLKYRHQNHNVQFRKESGVVHINAGLWLGEPDLEAMTWLVQPGHSREFRGKSLLLGEKTWSPVNTQNTALWHEAVVAYYFLPMGYNLQGLRIDRFGDIFSGYFVQKCARHLGFRIRVGTPLVDHKRNAHNYLRDAASELACIWLLEEIIDWLKSTRLSGHNYSEAYLSLADAIDEQISKFKGFIWDNAAQNYFKYVTRCMRIWVSTVKKISLL